MSHNLEPITRKEMFYEKIINSAGGGGGGGSATLIEKSITANGEYNASSDNADGYSKVNANVVGANFNKLKTLVFISNSGTGAIRDMTLVMPDANNGYSLMFGPDGDPMPTLALPATSIKVDGPNGEFLFTPNEDFSGFTYEDQRAQIVLSGDDITNGDGKMYLVSWEYNTTPSKMTINFTITKTAYNYVWDIT